MIFSKLVLWVAVWFQLIAASALSVAFAGADSFELSLMNYLPVILLVTAGATSLLAKRMHTLH